jgi:hypothetical protein
LKNGRIIEAKVKRTLGRCTFVVPKQGLKDTGSVKHIRVIGCEDQTPAEKARHQFLRDSLSLSHGRKVPFFVKAIWFPKDLKGYKGRRNTSTKATSCKPSHLVEKLNISQREAATAMLSVSGKDSLVVVHGILHEFLSRCLHINTYGVLIVQVLRVLERLRLLRRRRRHGWNMECPVGWSPNRMLG